MMVVLLLALILDFGVMGAPGEDFAERFPQPPPAETVPGTMAIDLGNGQCVQSDGQIGVWDGSTADDAGCVTEAEYAVMFGAETLDESSSSNPEWEPDAPSIREVLYPRLAFGVHPI